MEQNRFVEALGVYVDALSSLREGTLPLDFAAVHYRMGAKGVKTQFRRGILSANAQFSYSGDSRLELNWSSRAGNFKLFVTEADEGPVYRFSFKREF